MVKLILLCLLTSIALAQAPCPDGGNGAPGFSPCYQGERYSQWDSAGTIWVVSGNPGSLVWGRSASGSTFAGAVSAPTFTGTGTGGWVLDTACVTAPGNPATGLVRIYNDCANNSLLTELTAAGVKTVIGGGAVPGGTTGDLASYNFDSGQVPSTSTGSPAIDSTRFASAPSSAHFTVASQYYTVPLSSTVSGQYIRVKMQVNSANTNSLRLMALFNNGSELGTVYFSSSANIFTVYDDASATSKTCATSSLSTGSFHTLEVHWVTGSTTGVIEARIDGTTTCSFTGLNTGTLSMNSINVGQVNAIASPWDFNVDNFDVSSTGWIGQ